MATRIFETQATLRPSAMRTVAERRFDDTAALCDTRKNARANGAACLAGFVVEILLKAMLVAKYPFAARRRMPGDEAQRSIWSLVWRSHDLADMLDQMPELAAGFERKSRRAGYDYLRSLRNACGTWTVQARDSTQTIPMDDAVRLLERVRALKEVPE